MKQIRADKIEPIVFKKLSEYVGRLQEDENIFEQILENQSFEKRKRAGSAEGFGRKKLY